MKHWKDIKLITQSKDLTISIRVWACLPTINANSMMGRQEDRQDNPVVLGVTAAF